MAIATPPAQRATSSAALPKMRATFPLQVMGEMGLNNGDIWWMDPGELLFWCPELLQVGTDMRGRVDLRNGRTIEVHLRLLQGEVPLRHEKGYLQIASWSAAVARDGKVALDRLRETCPAVFKSDYRPPRLPAPTEAAAEAARVREPTEVELLATRHSRDMAEEEGALAILASRKRAFFASSTALGLVCGAALAMAAQEPSSIRWFAYSLKPSAMVERDLLAGVNFAGRDLSHGQFARADLSGAILIGASLASANLSSAQLSGADLRRTELSGANLSGAILAGAKLDGASLRGADLRGTDVACEVSGADLEGAVYSSETRWQNGKIAPGAVGPGAMVAGRRFVALSAIKMDLSRADFSLAIVRDGALSGANLAGANFSGADLEGTELGGTDLSDATLAGVQCGSCGFSGAKVDRVVAVEGQFNSADFRGSVGEAPNFQRAVLTNVKFAKSIWTDADLRGATLVGADLSDVVWARCALSGADLGRSTLSGAQLSGCVSDGDTKWPAGAAARNYGVLEIVANGDALGAVLTEAVDLSGRDLHGLQGPRMTAPAADWSGADLSGADLSNASLVGNNFQRTNLSSANFAGANVSNSDFGDADLAGASLAQADVCGADFGTANLAGADFSRATACSNTRWPKNRPPKGITIK